VPQASFAVPGLHCPPSQQPFEQLAWVHVHWPATHSWPEAQALPQLPQFCKSVEVLTQLPLQSVVPVGQTHCPLTQLAPVGQALLHEPQLFGSVLTLTHWPPQGVCPLGHSLGAQGW
jgi:hypothetical protein